MTGYLSNLAQRTLEQQPLAVLPRLASIFEPPSTAIRAAATPRAQPRDARSPRAYDRGAPRQFELQSPDTTAVFPSKQATGDKKVQTPPRVEADEAPRGPIHLREPAALRSVETGEPSRYHIEPRDRPDIRYPGAVQAADEHREAQEPPPLRPTLATHSDSKANPSEQVATLTRQTVTVPTHELPPSISPQRVIEVAATKRERRPPDEPIDQDDMRRRTIPHSGLKLANAFRSMPAHQLSERALAQGLPSERPSTIRITIGRVDVRAIMPGAQPALRVAEEKKPSRGLSLDEYLKQRSGAHR